MTFPCKEELIALEQLAKRQHRIYDDACDFGIRFDEYDRGAYQVILKDMLKVFGKPRFGYKTEKSEFHRAVEFLIPIEMDEGQELGIKVRVSSNFSRRVAGGGYTSIDIDRYSRPYVRN